jgi:hypothetical protein
MAHAASAGRQPPEAVTSGGVTAAAIALPAAMDELYKPVTRPTLVGNDSFTTTGTSTLHTAMPAHATSVPPSSSADPASTRTTRPAASSASAPAMAGPPPSRRDSQGDTRAARPKQMDGAAVTALAQAEVAVRPRWTSPSTEERLVTEMRRLAAASVTATASRVVPASTACRERDVVAGSSKCAVRLPLMAL